MGIRASLTRIPPEIPDILIQKNKYEPDESVLGGNYDWRNFHDVSLDKAWYGFDKAFKQTGIPLKYAIEGNYHYPGGLDAWNLKERDFYLGYVSAEIVRDISPVLSKLSYPDIVSIFERAQFDYDEYNQRYFEELRHFYEEVAENREAVMIFIA